MKLATISDIKTKYLEALDLKSKGYSISSISKCLNIDESEVLNILSSNDYSNKTGLAKIRSAEMAATMAAYDAIIRNLQISLNSSTLEFNDILNATKVLATILKDKSKLLGLETFVSEMTAEKEIVAEAKDYDYSKLTPEQLNQFVDLLNVLTNDNS